MRVGGSVVDTPEELNRSIEFLQYQQQIAVVQSWAEQNKLSARNETDFGVWARIFLLLDIQATELADTIAVLKTRATTSLGTAIVQPRDLIFGVRKSLGC